MKTLVCLLEEPSAEEMLKGILPRLIPTSVYTKYIPFEGKQDLEKNLERRLKYWQSPDSYFLVMRDKDSGDCINIKKNLQDQDKVIASGKRDVTIIRIACHELESFYLGDLAAVENGLGLGGLSELQRKSKYRTPDNLANAAEELFKITKKKYRKKAGSRAISPHLKIDGSNKSHSFNVLIDGIRTLIN